MLENPDTVTSPSAIALIRRRAPRRLVCEPGAIVNRAVFDLRPKRIDVPKVAAALVRQLRPRGPAVPAHLFLPQLDAGDAETTLGLLPDFPSIAIGADLFPSWLDEIERLDEPLILGAIGERAAPTDDAHARLARSLVAHSRGAERHLTRMLAERAREALAGKDPRSSLYAAPLVAEERPGKAIVLSQDEATLKLQSKKWLAAVAKDEGRPALEPEAGFGVGGAVFSPAEFNADVAMSRARTITIASFDGRFPDGGLNMSSATQLRDAIEQWLLASGAPAMASFKQLYLAVPWLAVAAAFSEALQPALQPRAGISAPDAVFGWHPTLTAIEMAAVAPMPALFVHTGRFPIVHVVAAWSDR